MKPHARPSFTERHDLWWVGLALMLVSALIVVVGLWWLLAWFLSLGSDIRRALP